jgi:SAM-dependent methyltransferase
LKRLDPVDRDFGWRWGKVIDRYYIEEFLQECAGDVGGNVLEVADNTYTVRFGGAKVTRSDVLHRKPGNPKATIVADLTQAEQIPSNRFDCIILTQTLQFVYCMQAAVRTLYRILKPGGVLLVSCHGISQISPVDMELWGEYWRFTSLSLHKLLNEAFPENQIAVKAYGNVHTAAAFLYGLNAGDLRPEALKYQDPNYEVVLCARVVKPKSQEANK